MIVFDKVNYNYHNSSEKALTDISFKIEPGEFVVVLGANGSGKTTLLKHINGLLTPTKGAVIVNDINTTDRENSWKIRSHVGMVFQNPEDGLIAATVEEDVAFGPENMGMSGEKVLSRVEYALKLVDMEDYYDRPCHMLSGGEKQRVALAGAIAAGSQYLVLDEATSMLDPRGREDFLALITNLNQNENLTLVMVTHNMNDAVLASRALVLREGRIFLDDTLRRVFSSPELEEIGIEVPFAKYLSRKLASRGLEIKTSVLTEDELVDEICSI